MQDEIALVTFDVVKCLNRVNKCKMKLLSLLVCFALPFMASGNDELRKLEKMRLHEVREAISKDGITITGFYHISAWRPRWQEVVMDQLYTMAGKRSALGDHHSPSASKDAPTDSDRGFTPSHWAALLDIIDRLQINIASPEMSTYTIVKKFITEGIRSTFTDDQFTKIRFSYNATLTRGTFAKSDSDTRAEYLARGNLSEGESSTLARVKDYCEAQVSRGKRTLVFYIHDKGACCYPSLERKPSYVSVAVAAWRDVMNAAVLEFPSICARAVLGGYSVCGYGSQGDKAHFTGNFWWADCGHVAALPRVSTYFDAWKAEFFLMRTSRNMMNRMDIMHRCAYEIHHCGGNHYAEPCQREAYLQRLLTLLNHSQLPVLSSALSDREYARKRRDKRVDVLKYTDARTASNWSPSSLVLTRECRALYESHRSYMSSPLWSSSIAE